MKARRTWVAALAGSSLLVAGAATASTSHSSWPYQTPPSHRSTAVLAVVGDVACEPEGDAEAAGQKAPNPKYLCDSERNTAQTSTAAQIEAMHPDLVALLGDEQYQVGRYNDFMGSFDKTYGAFKFLQRPAPGNHEFYDYKDGEKGVDGTGYFAYYNGRQLDATGTPLADGQGQPLPLPSGQAGETGQGWYSYDVGNWHVVSLNIECKTQPGGCSADGQWMKDQTTWLAQDLSQDKAPCTVAYWHQPAFSAADDLSTEGALARQEWWPLLQKAGVDVVLNGHEHLYARFNPVDADGTADSKHGIRQFIIGTGGEGLDDLAQTPGAPQYVTGQDTSYGVAKFQLQPHGYTWTYTTTDGQYTDSGSAACHR